MFEPRWDTDELDWMMEESQQIKTPFFILDENRLEDNIVFLKNRLGTASTLCFSVKANPWYAARAAELADYVEICSHGEWELCRELGIPPEKIIVGGIYKGEQELQEWVESRPHRISIESLQQLKQADQYAFASDIKAEVLLRISSGNQFGMDADMVIEILKHQQRFPSLCFKGIHYYSGTQKKQVRDLEKDIALLESVGRQAGGTFKEIEYGPGLGVPQFQNHNTDEYRGLFSWVAERLQTLAGDYIISLECGRLLTADTGIYVTKIVDKKTNNGKNYYIVDGGIHHLQYNGQIKGQHTPFIYAGKNDRKDREKEVVICGALCTANDILARSVYLPEKKSGERIVFMNAGAYCVTDGMSLFLSRALPGIIVKKQHGLAVMRNQIASYPFNMKWQ